VKFLIRDDDACAITSPEEIIRCYEGIWDRIPVGLAVTPFRIPGDHQSVPKALRGRSDPLPLDANPDMVAFLKEMRQAGKIDILLHGYDHSTPGGLPEYVGGTDLLRKTREGKQYLEELLGFPVDTFVPPNNGIGREGLEAIIACGLNLVNIPSLLRKNYRPFQLENVPRFLLIQYYWRIQRMKYPYILNFQHHKEVDYYSITPSGRLEFLLEKFSKCNAARGIFIAAIHYHAFDKHLKGGQSIRQALDILLERADGLKDIEYPTFSQMWQS